MTTNLTAYRYDLGSTPVTGFYTGGDLDVYTSGGALSLHPADASGPLNKARYTYPGNRTIADNETPTPEYLANPRIGLLYTWDAVTAGKGGSTGLLNEDGNMGDNESGFYPEGTNSGIDEEKRRQGICPIGWHLPNDYEWTELEQEILKETNQYADMADINPGAIDTDPSWVSQPTPGQMGNTSYRGTLHGRAMKDACEPYTAPHRGTSKKVSSNGFNILLGGFVTTGIAYDHNGNGRYFTSSSVGGDGANAWVRYVSSSRSTVSRERGARQYLLAIRCKKDN